MEGRVFLYYEPHFGKSWKIGTTMNVMIEYLANSYLSLNFLNVLCDAGTEIFQECICKIITFVINKIYLVFFYFIHFIDKYNLI